ncbi:MAG: DUF3566 domain-containing protein [Actinomycetota bacterium]
MTTHDAPRAGSSARPIPPITSLPIHQGEGPGRHIPSASPAASALGKPAEDSPRPTKSGARRVQLMLGRFDPWSVMKLGFLVSVALGIAFVVAVAVLWVILNGMGVFSDLDRTIGTVLGNSSGEQFTLMDYLGFGRIVSLATVVAVINVFLLTAISTLGAILYNISATLVGGAQMTLTDD